MNIYVFCIFPVSIADDENIPKLSILINMIHTAILVLKFIINLRLKKLGDIPNFIRQLSVSEMIVSASYTCIY